jgi:hypothetical protein
MAKDKDKTLADYVAIAISPALIMALVGSLVFFLVEILYVGEYQLRLLWILFFFVFGAVLVARVSMTAGIAERAGLYGIILGLLVWIALQRYVEYPPSSSVKPFAWAINIGLIAIIWWSAHRLTWDCTLIDDNVDASGAGLLEAAGLDQNPDAADKAPAAAEAEAGRDNKKRRKQESGGFIGWLERYRRYRDRRRQQPHTPGVWVVYFSLAALPIFGLGQSLIPVEQAGRRRYVFWLMVIYVASGLGLLLTTSFLGLRRYLRQRKLQMPVAMPGVWLTVGAILVVALLLIGALLPRPTAEYRVLELAGLAGSPEREASEWAQKGDSPGKGEGRPASEKPGRGHEDAKGSGQHGQHKGDAKTTGSEGRAKDKDGQGNGEKKGDASKGGGKLGKAEDGKKRDKDDKKADGQSDPGKPPEPPEADDAPPDSSSSEWLSEFGKKLATVLKWLVAIVICVVVLFYLLRAGLTFLANFTEWARRLLEGLRSFWQGLWGWWPQRERSSAADGEVPEAAPSRPFASFRDPFKSGKAQRMSPDELVRYSFEALQAWAVERGLARQAGETPLEFAARLGEEFPPLEGDLRMLAGHYAGLAYARRSAPPECRDSLQRLWLLLAEVVERPLSAAV